MTINKDALPISCNTAKEWKICVESWRFFRTSSLSALRQALATRSSDTFEELYKAAIIVQGCNASLDDSISFVMSQYEKNGHNIPCHLGCSACCKQAITATPFEAALVGIYLITHPAICNTFLDNYIQWDTSTKDIRDSFMDWAQQFFSANIDDGRFKYTDFRTPCPFLVDDLCQIYPVRPYCCRSYMAITDQCKSPVSQDERPGFKGIDVGSCTDFKQHNNTLLELLWDHFGIDKKKIKVRLLPDLVYMFLNGDSDKLLNYCLANT